MARVKRQQLQLFRQLFADSAGAWTPEIELACLEAFTNNLCLDLMGDQVVALMFMQGKTPTINDLQAAIACIPKDRWAHGAQAVSYWAPTWNQMTADCIEVLADGGCRIGQSFQALTILLSSSNLQHHQLAFQHVNVDMELDATNINTKILMWAASHGNKATWAQANINNAWNTHPMLAKKLMKDVFGSAANAPIQPYLAQTMNAQMRQELIESMLGQIDQRIKQENVAHYTHLMFFWKREIEYMMAGLEPLFSECNEQEQVKWFKRCKSKGLPVSDVLQATADRLNIQKHVDGLDDVIALPAPRKKM